MLIGQIPALQLVWRLLCNDLVLGGNDDLGWAVLFDFLLYVTLPLSWIWSIVFSLVLCGEYLGVVGYMARNNRNFYLKVSQVASRLWKGG